MKNLPLIIVLLFSAVGLTAQSEVAFFDLIIRGDFDKAENYFDDNLDIRIGDFEDMLSKGEALAKIRSFFQEKQPDSYTIKHHGKSKGGQSSYYVSNLHTIDGNYRFFVYFEKMSGKSLINEIRIEGN